MASTHKKTLTVSVRPSSLLSDFPVLVYFSGDTDIGARISNINELRFYTTGGVALNWMNISLSGAGSSLSGWARVVVPSVLSSADLQIECHYGGTPSGTGAPSTTLSLSGLVAAYDLESTSPADWSGNGYDATGVSSPPTQTGKIGTAADYDGSTDYSYVVDSAAVGSPLNAINSDGQMYLSAWVKPDSISASPIAWMPGHTIACARVEATTFQAPFSFGLDYVGAVKYAHFGKAKNHIVDYAIVSLTSTPVDNGSWHHLAAVNNDIDVEFFVDGLSIGSDTLNSYVSGDCSLGASTANFFLGARSTNIGGSVNYFDGGIDDLRIFSGLPATGEIAYQVAQTNSPGSWGSETSLQDATVIPIIANISYSSDFIKENKSNNNWFSNILHSSIFNLKTIQQASRQNIFNLNLLSTANQLSILSVDNNKNTQINSIINIDSIGSTLQVSTEKIFNLDFFSWLNSSFLLSTDNKEETQKNNTVNIENTSTLQKLQQLNINNLKNTIKENILNLDYNSSVTIFITNKNFNIDNRQLTSFLKTANYDNVQVVTNNLEQNVEILFPAYKSSVLSVDNIEIKSILKDFNIEYRGTAIVDISKVLDIDWIFIPDSTSGSWIIGSRGSMWTLTQRGTNWILTER